MPLLTSRHSQTSFAAGTISPLVSALVRIWEGSKFGKVIR